ncbi:MAG: hypothetical protein JRC90_04525 [Deltaproteobacteria bacterium]|nr:hypothetical protein [Deltaproteobacteria bacterium]
MRKWLFLTILIVLATSCTPMYVWRSTPQVEIKANDIFDVELEPISIIKNQYNGFRLKINNRTRHDLELNWDKTLYLDKDMTNGGVMFEGILYKERNAQKSPDIIFASSTFEKKIFPNNLVEFAGNHWIHRPLPGGYQGVYLTIVSNGKEIHEKVTVHISIHKHQ